MIYNQDGEWHQLARISGPYHNLLGLVLERAGPRDGVRAEAVLLADEGGAEQTIDPARVAEEVEEGLRQANLQFGTTYEAVRIRYVASDTPENGIYETLAYAIVERVQESIGRPVRRAAGR